MSTGTSSLRTIGTELSKKQNLMVKKRMQRNHEEWHLTYGSWNITEIIEVCKLYMQHTICSRNIMIFIFFLIFLYHGCHELLLICFRLCLMNVFKAWMGFQEEWRVIPYNSVGCLTTGTYKYLICLIQCILGRMWQKHYGKS